MNKKILLSIAIAICWAIPVLADNSNSEFQPTQKQLNAQKNLQDSVNNLRIDWDTTNTVPKHLRVSNDRIKWSSDNPVQKTYDFFDAYKDLYKISNPHAQLKIISTTTDELGMTHVTVQQEKNNVPVYGSQLKIHFRADGSLATVNGSFVPNINDLKLQPTVSEYEATRMAKNHLQEYVSLSDEEFQKLDIEPSATQLVIYQPALFGEKSTTPRLSWKILLTSNNAAIEHNYYIDAQNSDIITQYSMLSHAKDRNTYTLEDCDDTEGELIYNEAGIVGDYDVDAEWVHLYVGYSYDYYSENFSRDSYDGEGGTISSYTHYEDETLGFCVDEFNAFWRYSEGALYFARGVYGQDIVGHEFTHGVIDYTAALERSGTALALHESYADVFAVLIEAYAGEFDWVIGEDLSTNRSDECIQAVRDLSNPSSLTGDCDGGGDVNPDHINDLGGDYSDEHASGNIPSHAFYLLTAGGTHAESGETVTGIEDLDIVGDIYYRALTTYLTPDADFEDAYTATVTACLDLYESDSVTYPLAYCESIFDAFHAVGIETGDSFLEITIEATPADGYAPLTVTFDASSSVSVGSTITDYNWFFSDGGSDTGAVVTHEFTEPGSFAADLTVIAADGTEAVATYAIEVFNPIAPYFIISGDGVAAPATVSFDASGTVIYSGTITDYTWDFGDGTTVSSGTSVTTTHTYTDPGSYTVTLTVTDNGGYTETTEMTAVVYPTSTISSDMTFDLDHSPYVISGDVTLASGYTLTIDPGVVVKFLDTTSSLTINGTLDAIGTSTSQIVFTSFKDDVNGGDTNGDGSATTPAAGDWYYFKTTNGSTINLDYVTVQYGGYTGARSDYAMFFIDDNTASVTIDHSTFQDSSYYTLKIDPGSTSTIQNSSITNTAGQRAIYITGGTSILTANTISSGGSYGIYIDDASPTIIDNQVNDSTIGLYVQGSSATPTITNNTFTGNSYGLYAGSSASPSIMDNTFTNNTYCIYLNGSITSSIALTGNTGSSNTYNAIGLTGSTSGDFTLDMANDLLYAFDGFTVASGNTLTIDPGTVVKFLNATSYMIVNGTLSADGTSADPIIFTSYKDDTFGGDTNEDGTLTTPEGGDWYYFKIASGGTAYLDYVTMQYGGSSAGSTPMLRIDDNAASVTVDHSTLQNSGYVILEIDPGSTSTIQNSAITNTNNQVAIYSSGGSSVLSGNTITASNSSGVYVYGASPTITDNIFTDSAYGIYARNDANPVITGNSFYDNTTYGVYNTVTSVTINAENNWWGDTSGPYNSTSNPTAIGDDVSSDVDFDPWLTADPTIADTTPPADVGLGTISKDVWTPSVTVNWTNPADTDFNHVQIDRTDVSTGITTTMSSTEIGASYTDSTPSYATTYTYTLYAVDTTGNVSTGVTTASQRLQNPKPVQRTLTSGDTMLTVNWNASSARSSTIAGYKVYYGTAADALTSVIDVGNVTTTTLTGLTNFTRYYVAVSAYNRRGMESDISNIRVARPHP